MAATDAILRVQVLVDNTKAKAGMEESAGLGSKIAGGLRKAAVPAAAVIAGVVAIGKEAGESASAVQQAMGGIDAVFGESAEQVKKWSDQAASSVGLAKSEYGDLATLIGSQLKNAGLPMEQVASKTNDLIKLGADLAATYGGTTADAVEALSSALKGEMDPLEAYGTSLSQTKIAAELAAKGQDKLKGSAAASAKTNATLGLIMKQTSAATGKFAKEADTAAGQQARAAAGYENTKAALGAALLPAMTKGAEIAGKLAVAMGENAKIMTPLVAVIVALAAAVLVANAVMSAWGTIVKVATGLQWAWNAAMAANPVLLIVLAVVALTVAIVVLWKKSTKFRAFILAMWSAIRTAAVAVARAIAGAWNALIDGIRSGIAAVTSWLRTTWANVWGAIKSGASDAVAAIKRVWNGIIGWIREHVTDPIKRAFSAVWDLIGKAANSKLGKLLNPINAIKSAFDAVVGAIRTVVDWIGRIKFPSAPKWLSKIPGVGRVFGGTAAAGGVSRMLTAAPAASSSSSAGGVTINLYGVLDAPDAARKIRAVLRDDDRRRAGVRTTGVRASLATGVL